MSPSVQARAKITRRHSSYGRDSCTLRVFEGNPMNLDKGHNGADYGRPLNSDWNSGHSCDDFEHIYWEFLGEGIVCSGVGVGSVVRITGGARVIACCRGLAMDYNLLVVVFP